MYTRQRTKAEGPEGVEYGEGPPPRKFLIITNKLINYHHHDDVKGPQHYIKHLKITFLVLLCLWYNSDVSFTILGYRY